MSRIVTLSARRVYDSRGVATVETTVTTESGAVGQVAAPSGASTGAHEVQALPEGGVSKALREVAERVRPRLLGVEVADQVGVDARLHESDGTPDFSAIGGNTATAVSLSVAIAHASEARRPLWQVLARPGVRGTVFPAIVGNCLNGGRHAIGGPDIQEFHAISSAKDPSDSVRAALEVHKVVGETLHARWPTHALGRGDEGGWVAPVGNLEALEILSEACRTVRDRLKLPVAPGLDLAASEFYRDGKYRYREQALDAEGQLDFLVGLVDRFGLTYLEDPFDEEDFDSFGKLTRAVGTKAMVVGDDLFTTRLSRLRTGVDRKATNSILIKVNQVGTLTDTFETVDFARSSGLTTVASHRSGDLPEGWLSHLAVGIGAAGLKCGLLGGERAAKLNELLRLGGAHEG
ncbi:MAG: enolase [Thermoplasmata archaeon]|nr:enolase [Thermoplasmata archaeon]